ncbi:MAG: cardiolipin synthase [Clostridium sp.]|nr:cardiolipin synthase [Clostridium sp.]MCM1399139.1 cardiolipin synthase [Clostridium sp.]MCM1459531.1 cardiolipin synthase [Bacteroides sp.]
MEKGEKKVNIGSTNRNRQMFVFKMLVVVTLIVLQIILSIKVYSALEQYVIYWRSGAVLLSMFVVLYIVNKQDNPAYKLAWVVVVLAAPLIGGTLYVMLAGNRTRVKFIEEALENHTETFEYMPDDTENLEEIKALSKSANVQSTYISKTAGYPVYKNTSVKYFPLGEENYACLMEELKKAKHFIFMEYFIIKQGEMWESILEVLAQKAAEGVDVRLIYDDFGCAMWIPSRFIANMKALGIKAAPFNPVVPIISLRQNNRDHRKITVIDGHTGFTGGINIADEYINKISRFGHWKDTGIMLKGEAVWNLTVMFLQTWRMLTKEEDDYSMYAPMKYKKTPVYSDGYIQPYGDTPVDDEIVGENIYINMITKAKHYVYITTPYLIIDNEMFTALSLAAKSGVDVRIITPGIPDKKTVYMVTQSYYYHLIKAGVKIYQYTPGFIHAKTFVADDKVATVGTINMDFRSLYLHFECGVWMFNSSVIFDIKEDYMKTLEKCDEVTLEELEKTGIIKRGFQSILRLISPLM